MWNKFFSIKLLAAGITIGIFVFLVAFMQPTALADDRNSDIVVSKDNGDVSIFSKDNLMCDGKSFLLSEMDCLNYCINAQTMCLAACLLNSQDPNCDKTCNEKREECEKDCKRLNEEEREIMKKLKKGEKGS